jgi:putative ABC transport system permease protein
MSVFSELRYRLRALVARGAMEREMDDELRFHIEREMEKHMAAGLSRAEAERRARLAFGGVERIKDDTRDARGVGFAERLTQDFRYAWRAIRARPGFAAAIVVTLGLGIGANAAMFGIVDRLLFRSPPYLVDADRVHRVYVDYFWDGVERSERTIEYKRFLDLSRGNAFDRTGVVAYRDFVVGTGDAAREMRVAVASAGFLGLFDARPVIGRFFGAEEDRPPMGATVVVLGYDFWRREYNGRADALGQSLRIDRTIYTIIGVAPQGFVGVTDEKAPALFIPVTTFAGSRRPDFHQQYGWSWLEMFARRKPGVSVATADADLTAAYQRSWNTEKEQGNAPTNANVARARAFAGALQLSRGPEAGPESRVATWVMAVAIIVLLVACANVANLLLARAVSRRREIAVRLALGVTRGRLMQQLLTESVLLALLGGAAGLVAAQWGGKALGILILRDSTPQASITDPRTLAFVAATALGVAILTGLAPALHAVRDDVAGSLKAGVREGTMHRSRLRSALLLFQGAFSLVLLVGAGLFVRSLTQVRAERLGYDVEPVIYAEGDDRGVQFTPADVRALVQRMLDAAASMPGVRSVTPTISVPFWSNEGRGAPHVPGRDSLQKLGRFTLQAGTPSYFATMGTRILRGRGFTQADVAGSLPVVVVSQAMANAIWPGQDAIGQIMRLGSDTTPYMTVVGIAEDMRARSIQGDPEFWYYLPMAQFTERFGEVYPALFVRVAGRAEDMAEPLRRRLQREMPGASYVRTTPLQTFVAPQQRSWQFGATMFVAFGGLALVLAAIGLYSVVTYGVAQRTHELGVRIALGAGVGDVVRLVLAQAVRFAVGGILIGGAIAFWASSRMQPLLYRTSAHDPLVFGCVAALLVAVAVVATLRPALRATRVDPTIALRAD